MSVRMVSRAADRNALTVVSGERFDIGVPVPPPPPAQAATSSTQGIQRSVTGVPPCDDGLPQT
jgi:hypothetical protein